MVTVKRDWDLFWNITLIEFLFYCKGSTPHVEFYKFNYISENKHDCVSPVKFYNTVQ